MEASNMKRIEKAIKYLATNMDEYTYEEYVTACQNIADDANNTIFDKYYKECAVHHLRELQSLYRFLKMGQYY